MLAAKYLTFMNSDHRHTFYIHHLNPEIDEHRAVFLNGLSDRSQYVREDIVKRFDSYSLTDADTAMLAKTLTTQSSGLRRGIITLLKNQRESLIRPVIDTLLDSQNNNQIVAGVELLDVYSKKNLDFINEYMPKISALAEDSSITKDVSIILDKIMPEKASASEYTAENGFGLFNPKSDWLNEKTWEAKRPSVPFIDDAELRKQLVPDKNTLIDLYKGIAGVFERFKDYEY
jgi:hypothetical protein